MTYGMGQNEHSLEQHACFTEYLQLYEDRLADYVGKPGVCCPFHEQNVPGGLPKSL